MAEVRTLEHHQFISNYLKNYNNGSLWWIGATDAKPESPEEGTFVWLTDRSEVNPYFEIESNQSKSSLSKYSDITKTSLWGPGQPDNWPNQVRI